MILDTLNDQMQFEEKIPKEKLINGDISTVLRFRDLSRKQKGYLEKIIIHGKDIWKHLDDIEKNGEHASERLRKAINANYKEDQDKIKEIDKQIEQIEEDKKTKKKDEIKNQTDAAKEDIKKVLNYFGKKMLESVIEKSADVQPQGDVEIGVTIEGVLTKIEEIEKVKNEIKWYHHRIQMPSKSSLFAFILATVLPFGLFVSTCQTK